MTMADHGEVHYSTADGNDYREHEGTYLRFLGWAFALSAYVIAIVIGLAIVGTTHSPGIGVGVIVIASLLAVPAIVTGSKTWSLVSVGIAAFALAAAAV
jgi:hypothetical protein